MSSYIGIDIGTTACKAISFDESGQALASAHQEYPLLTPQNGWAELDSEQVIKSCFEVIRETVSKTEIPIKALAISSQGEAFTPIDAKGEILANAMVSSDTRASAASKAWSNTFGAKELYKITGHTPHPMFTFFKLLWLRKNQTDIWNKACKFLCFEDLLQFKLGLEPAISWSLAGRTMLFDIKKHCWDKSILNQLELDSAKLARPLKSGSIAGHIAKPIAEKLGLPSGVAVVSGGHDQGCGALGAGVVREGLAMYATGTVECIAPAFLEPRLSDSLFQSNLCTYDYTANNMYTTVAFSLTGGNILKWFKDTLGQEEVALAAQSDKSSYDFLLGKMPAEPGDLLVLPYFTPTGTPYFDTKANGAILGLKLSTGKGEIIRALLEGVAFEMRLNLDILNTSGIKINELRAIGGGAKSQVWTQLKADVLNKSIVNVEVTEAGCLGAAALAFAADTGNDLSSIIDNWVKTVQTTDPDPKFAERYSDKFETYKKLYPTLKTLKIN